MMTAGCSTSCGRAAGAAAVRARHRGENEGSVAARRCKMLVYLMA